MTKQKNRLNKNLDRSSHSVTVKSAFNQQTAVFQLRGLLPYGLAPYPAWPQIPASVRQLTQTQREAALRSLHRLVCDKLTGCREIMRASTKLDWHEPNQSFRSEH